MRTQTQYVINARRSEDHRLHSSQRSRGQAIAVTGMGLTTALGYGLNSNWSKLIAGVSGIRSIHQFSTNGLKASVAATTTPPIATTNWQSPADRIFEMSKYVLEEALQQSELSTTELAEAQVFYATPSIEPDWDARLIAHDVQKPADIQSWFREIETLRDKLDANTIEFLLQRTRNGFNAERLRKQFGFIRPAININTACASGSTAIKLAIDALRRGAHKTAIVIGADANVTSEVICRFALLQALSTKEDCQIACRPFDINRDGFVMGEGAAALILQRPDDVALAKHHGYVMGCGSATDNFHKTRSHPEALKIVECMENAILDSGLTPDAIDSINAHGTSTPENDKLEAMGINKLFGARTLDIPVTSNKSMIGHTLCAAGTIEAVISLLSLREQLVPPTIGLQQLDPEINLNIVRDRAQPRTMNYVLSNSFGFGGQNLAVVLGNQQT
jgi:3-oxoacyl-[acyl-carrier-protein] synthase II